VGVPVKIPGADAIDVPAPARDPGVTATPDSFGAAIGEGMQHLGNAAVEVGALMDRKREAAAAAMALPEATAKFQLDAIQRNQKIATSKPVSAAATGQAVDADLAPRQDQIIAETKAKYNLSDLDTAKLTGHLTTLRGHAVVNGVTQANNQIVAGLSTAHDDTVKTIAANALATGDVDGALKQVDQSVAALRGVVPENDLNIQAAKSKKYVVDNVIGGLKAAGTKDSFDKAEALTTRFYGAVPKSDIFNALYAQESGSGKNTATSVTGARGGMQIQPGTFAQYAKPGENIDNEKDNLAVGKRIVDDLSAKTGGDPARIAVGYFSGPGNIAPPGSPTPWKVDKADPTGKTVSSYVADVTKRLGGAAGKPELPDAERALYFNQQINQARTKTLATASADTENKFARQIIDANAGIGALPSRAAIESNPYLGEDTRNKLLGQYDSAASDVIKLQAAMKKFADPNGGSFNPFDKEDRGNVDRIYNALGGDLNALQTVTNRTGMVPEAAVSALRGAMVSPDPQKVEQALQTSANLVGGKYPDVFTNVKGGDDLTKTANTFRHYVYDRGMTAADATAKIIEERTPEYEQRVKARIKSEDVNEIVKKKLSDGDIRHAFDDSWIPFNDPKLTFSPEMRTRAMGDYEESFRENFAKNGDVSLSKTLALDEMKKTWGTTTVNGSKTVMKYPPERSPVYAGIENPSEQIALQAVSAIKDLNGKDVDRSKIRLDEVKNTADRFMRGLPPVYVLSYVDDKGHVQTIPKQFYADPVQMRSEQIAKRAAESAKIQTRAAIDADNADLSRANFGVQ
jgi:soluble lytic murein transglycosylase-like protein